MTTSMKAFLWIAAATTTAAVWWYSWARERRIRATIRTHLAKHPEIAPGTFGETYFPVGKAEIADRVYRVFIQIVPPEIHRAHPDDGIVDDLYLDDLDSLGTVEFVIALEKEFGIELPDAETAKARTLRDLVDLIAAQIAVN
jgi:acyl carrier protein